MARSGSIIRLMCSPMGMDRPTTAGGGKESKGKGSWRSFAKRRGRKAARLKLKNLLYEEIEMVHEPEYDPMEEIFREMECDDYWDDLGWEMDEDKFELESEFNDQWHDGESFEEMVRRKEDEEYYAMMLRHG